VNNGSEAPTAHFLRLRSAIDRGVRGRDDSRGLSGILIVLAIEKKLFETKFFTDDFGA
jgi:hypothetical protein